MPSPPVAPPELQLELPMINSRFDCRTGARHGRRSRGRGGIMIGSATLCTWATRPRFDELTLDQLLAAPIVRQLMRRDRVDEATIRRLVQETAAGKRPADASDY